MKAGSRHTSGTNQRNAECECMWQEKRMCLAMEVMITFTENIRRLREKEQADVEEARSGC